MAALQADRKTNPQDVINALGQGQEVELTWDGPLDNLFEGLQRLVGLKLTARPTDNGHLISVSRDYQPSDKYHSPRGWLDVTFEDNQTVHIETSSVEPLAIYIGMAAMSAKKVARCVVANGPDEMNRQYEIISFDPIAAKLTARRRRRPY